MTRIDLDGEDAADGLIALVVAVVELLVESMEREAVRRMEADQLTDDEIERIGSRFAAIEAELDQLKDETGVTEGVEDLRGQLDGLVSGAIQDVDAENPVIPDDNGQRLAQGLFENIHAGTDHGGSR